MQKPSFVLSADYNLALVIIFAIFATTGMIVTAVRNPPSQPAENATTRQAGPVSGNSVVHVEVSSMWSVRSVVGGGSRREIVAPSNARARAGGGRADAAH